MDLLKLVFDRSGEPLLFHSGYFLFIFALFMIYYAFVFHKQRLRDISIILFGFYFYYKSSGAFILLLLLCISTDYVFSIWIHRTKNLLFRKMYLVSGITFSLSFLLYFKYWNFFMENVASITETSYTPEHIILPIGISFYTFQSISYLVDVYQNKIQPSSFKDYIFYMTFFPHLVAGPIVRAKDFVPQISRKISVTYDQVNEALYLISKGLIKKAIIADFVGQYADTVFTAPEGFSGTENLIAVLCYSLQIFCDFSGYTDMAIGIALLLGFRLCVNFDSPYKALHITGFWRRWHISLSSWLRDYIYIPLGGNRKGICFQLLFLTLTMLIGGFWHGASWKFIFWGAGHGVLLCIHKLFTVKYPRLPEDWKFKSISWLFTFASVALLWVPFRALSINDTLVIYQKIFSQLDLSYLPAIYRVNPLLLAMVFGGFTATLLPNHYKEILKNKYFAMDFTLKLTSFIVLIQTILQVQSTTVQPFIYFQF